MPYYQPLYVGAGVVSGLVGTLAHVAEALANAHGEFNPLGQQPQAGGNPYDRSGGAPLGGHDPQPCGARSGVGGSGRNQATDCMTNCELNACNSCIGTPPDGKPGDPPSLGPPCESGICPKSCPTPGR